LLPKPQNPTKDRLNYVDGLIEDLNNKLNHLK